MRLPFVNPRREVKRMDKVKMILQVAQMVLEVVEDMRKLSDSVQNICTFMMEGLSEDVPKAIEVKPVKQEEQTISLEKVRGVLAQKSQAGFTAEVRGIIQKYGGSRLSDINPKDYKSVIEEAEGLGND